MRATNPGRDPSSRIALKYQCVCVDVQAHLRMYVCYDAGVFVDGMSLMCRTWLYYPFPLYASHLFRRTPMDPLDWWTALPHSPHKQCMRTGRMLR